ncbi:MAG: RNA polymerase sigma factor, partial [Actinomycetota bacterium]|nr:RNA polymerase sigma factor [Actinomycetota bacterium]
MGCSDEQLVLRVRDGDEAAFEAVYDRYAAGMLAFCRHLLGGPDEAEDALQQSFARAYRALREDVAPLSLKAWLYAIARNRCMTILAGRREVIDLDAVRHAVRPAEDCYSAVQRRADVSDLVDDLRRLPDNQRAALVLFELGGHSQDDIAEILGVQRARIKALVFQAREGLARAREARAA